MRALYTQVEKMFRAFHQYLVAYDHHKICQCKACISAVDLTLKVITHYGEFTPLRVQQFDKLFGEDVIVAHQLLKNDIPQHEYWLVTKDLHRQPVGLPSGCNGMKVRRRLKAVKFVFIIAIRFIKK